MSIEKNNVKKLMVLGSKQELYPAIQELLGGSFTLLSARDNDEAIQMLEEEVPDMVILDEVFPDVVAATCKEIRKKASDVPLILLSKNQSLLEPLPSIDLRIVEPPTEDESARALVALIMATLEERTQAVSRRPFKVLGLHTVVEFIDCRRDVIARADLLEPIVIEAVRQCGATYVSHSLKQFDPEGASGVVLIAESHLSFHSWPEHGYMALDIFTCSFSMDSDRAIRFIGEKISAQHITTRVIQRGYETP